MSSSSSSSSLPTLPLPPSSQREAFRLEYEKAMMNMMENINNVEEEEEKEQQNNNGIFESFRDVG